MEPRTKAKWQQRAEVIHERFLRLAQAKGGLSSDAEILNFLALAICGEAGELANLVKKMWRGDEVGLDEIRAEIADIRIYLEHLSRHLSIDLDRACERKLDVVAERLAVKEREAEARVGN
jgi:NTP pyrophosphatase (non-canonical NTP hydrolase)